MNWESPSQLLLAWLLTYAIHSTLLLGATWAVTAKFVRSPHARDFLWKFALVGAVVSTTAQRRLDVIPSGSLMLSAAPAIAPSDGLPSSRPSSAPTASRQSDRTTEDKNSSTVIADTGNAPPSSAWQKIIERVVLFAWIALATLLAGTYAARRLMLVGRLANRKVVTDGALRTMLTALCRETGQRLSVILTSVNTISSPVALGRREICVPEAALTELDAAEQHSLLAHELAHLTRRDPLWLDAASVIERVFFFQPLNRLARTELQRNAEYLCDDWAAARSGSGLPLANCLARVSEWIEASPLGVPVAGMAEQRSMLVTRIARLLEERTTSVRLSVRTMSVGALAMIAGLTAAVPGVNYGATVSTPAATRTIATRTTADTASDTSIDRTAHNTTDLTAHRSDENAVDERVPAVPVDPAVIAALIERLRDSDASVRGAAAAALGKLEAKAAVMPLIAAMTDRDAHVRQAVCEALSRLEDPRAVPAMVRLLSDESTDVRHEALDALQHFSEKVSASSVIPLASDASAEVRERAAELLGEIGDRSALPTLAKLLKDPVLDVRRTSMHALAELKDASQATTMLQALRDPAGAMRRSAMEALRELHIVIPVAQLNDALADSDANVRQQALEYVQDHPASVPVATISKLVDDEKSDVREQAVEALSAMRSPEARAALRAALNSSDKNVRRRAAEALGERP